MVICAKNQRLRLDVSNVTTIYLYLFNDTLIVNGYEFLCVLIEQILRLAGGE